MKKFIAGILVLIALIVIPVQLGTKVESTFTQVSTQQVQVTASNLVLRSGAGITHSILGYLKQGTILDVLGKIGNWYVVKTNQDSVGCVSSTYVKPYSTQTSTTAPVSTPTTSTGTSSSGAADSNSLAMQQEMLQYVNAARADAGLPALTLDPKLSAGAYLKSKDMADNNYFSHTSPTYGSPFEMMTSLGISYTAAGENIALNTSVKGAEDAFMNSSGHKANILGAQYKKAGFGFVQKGVYLYVTQWFTN